MLPIYQTVPVYGDINRMAAHINIRMTNTVPFISCYVTDLEMAPENANIKDMLKNTGVEKYKKLHKNIVMNR